MSRNYITDKEELVPEQTILGASAGGLTITDLDGPAVELACLDIAYVGDRAFLTGSDITYSTARGSTILKLAGTLTMTSGAFEAIDIKLATSGAFTD